MRHLGEITMEACEGACKGCGRGFYTRGMDPRLIPVGSVVEAARGLCDTCFRRKGVPSERMLEELAHGTPEALEQQAYITEEDHAHTVAGWEEWLRARRRRIRARIAEESEAVAA